MSGFHPGSAGSIPALGSGNKGSSVGYTTFEPFSFGGTIRKALVVLLLFGCTRTVFEPPYWIPSNPQRIEEPYFAAEAYAELRQCLDRPIPRLDRVLWWETDYIIGTNGEIAVGLWEGDHIYITSDAKFIVKHELAHYALQSADHHTPEFVKCSR